MEARKMSKKMPFSGQRVKKDMNTFKWNKGGLSSPKMTENKKTINEENRCSYHQ
jgi:hypothetical protein